jgi:hypothetical protein
MRLPLAAPASRWRKHHAHPLREPARLFQSCSNAFYVKSSHAKLLQTLHFRPIVLAAANYQ